MTPRERRLYHRKIERRCVQRARYALRWKHYAAAAQAVVEAVQQATAADCAASEETSLKIKKIQKAQRSAQRQGKEPK